PAPASAPLWAMLKPILMGAPPPWANAGADSQAGEMSAAPMPAFTWRRVRRRVMDIPPQNTGLVHRTLNRTTQSASGRPDLTPDPPTIPQLRKRRGWFLCGTFALNRNATVW